MRYQDKNSELHLPPQDLHRLIENCTDVRDKLVIEVLVYTGSRRAELTLLHKEDVDGDRCRLLVRQGKGG